LRKWYHRREKEENFEKERLGKKRNVVSLFKSLLFPFVDFFSFASDIKKYTAKKSK